MLQNWDILGNLTTYTFLVCASVWDTVGVPVPDVCLSGSVSFVGVEDSGYEPSRGVTVIGVNDRGYEPSRSVPVIGRWMTENVSYQGE